MAHTTSRKLLTGIVVPTVTPLLDDGSLDEAALRLLLAKLLEAHVAGLFVVGTTGEGPALSLATRRRVVEVTCEVAAGKTAIAVAAIESSAQEILRTSEHAKQAGADAIAIAPPYYLNLSEDDTVRVVDMVDAESALPAYLYNVPFANLPQFTLPVLRRVADRPRILGLKDSSGDFAQLCAAVDLFSHRAECSVLVGPERLLANALRAGADGGVCGGGNIFPKLYNALYDAALGGDDATVDALQARVLQVEEQIYSVGDPAVSLVRGLKAALALQGIGSTRMVRPYLPASDQETQQLRQHMALWQDVAIDSRTTVL